MKTIVEIAKDYAMKCHKETNHMYDNDKPYVYHLALAISIGETFIHLIPEEERDFVLAAIWCHDVIEDTRQTYNDVRQATNARIADLVFAVTNEKGKRRKDRANDKYYHEMRECNCATFVKLCDRSANIHYSVLSGGGKLEMYKKENSYFCSMVDDFKYPQLIDYMNFLLYGEKIEQV
jgi:(p)ppGpp synthase/HD superfamily hydrolase